METLHKTEHHLQSGKNFNKYKNPHVKPLHHKWGFWFGIVLIMVALSVYIVSEDFSIQPVTEQLTH